MLPFLQPKKTAAVIMMRMKPSGPEAVKEEGEHEPEIMASAEDLIKAVHSKDANAVASALKSAFQILDSMPHEEGEHI